MPTGKADFFGDRVGGILEDPDDPPGSAGDPDAIVDLKQDHYVPPVAFGVAEDGLPMPVCVGDQRAPSTSQVHEENFICLTCDHYIEMVAAISMVGDHEVRVVERRCSLMRTWAELGDLTEAQVLTCSGHSRQRPSTIYSGLCARGPCRHFVEMSLQGPLDAEPKTTRWCLALGGAARYYDLRDRIVRSCSVWRPERFDGPAIQAAATALTVAREVRDERRRTDDGDSNPGG